MDKNPRKAYLAGIKILKERGQSIKRQDYLLLTVKLSLVFLGIWFLLRILQSKGQQDLIVFGSLFIIFLLVSLLHEKVLQRKKLNSTLQEINRDELKTLEGDFLNVESGSRYRDEEHRYSADLDIFGERSLFHFVNRCRTLPGEDTLAQYFNQNADQATIGLRQQAVKELKDKIDFRQRMIAWGMRKEKQNREEDIINTLLARDPVMSSPLALKILNVVFPLLTLGSLFMAFFNLSIIYFFSLFCFQLVINFIKFKPVNLFYKLISRTAKILNSYAGIISEIEAQVFKSRHLKEMRGRLFSKQKSASVYIRKLSGIIQLMDLRLSALHFFINNILFWDLNLMQRFERWRRDAGGDIKEWFAVIGRLEALSSLANLYFNNPDWEMPSLVQEGFCLSGKQVGHPLIHQKERVCNDFRMEGNNRIVFVTGPNMAGKSTFLRTVGINIVLAFSGSAVCGKEFTLSEVFIHSSMKVSDSLDKHLSLFYAELKRLQKILLAISEDKMVFFLIDEMLKGTNELDRQKGAIALLKQLLVSNVRGIVATHDIELTKFEKSHPEAVMNYHFDGYVEGEKLLFDYLLKKGIIIYWSEGGNYPTKMKFPHSGHSS
jgi:hypothetical protein